ncbi:MAG: 3-oxoacyl-ACP reductase FabG [Gammaproteobacteria bacterium]|nr:3-oxoacyl-ACP reductase FabG [Gammaproteobacteria bacterium]
MTTTTLDNQVCLVTGASRGIGQAIALELGRQQGIVIGTSTTEQGAASITENFANKNIQGKGMVLDVTVDNAVDSLLKEINEAYGPPTILVNNAGITCDNLLMRMKNEEWDNIMSTNLKSIYRVSKACLRGMMKARNGRIINITSVVGVTGNAGQCNYAAAKAGVIGFTKSLALEVGSRGITVNAVAPGFIDTDMTRSLSEEQSTQLLQKIPLGRLGSVEDIATATGFLASAAAGYITGTTMHINGGMYMN